MRKARLTRCVSASFAQFPYCEADHSLVQYERQKEKHEDEEIRHALDDDLASIRSLLGAPNRREHPSRTRLRESSGIAPPAAPSNDPIDQATTPVASTSTSSLIFVKPVESEGGVDKSLLASLIGDADNQKDNEDDTVSKKEEPVRAEAPPRQNVDQVLANLPRFSRNAGGDNDEDEDDGDPYDRFVRELAFEKRAAPSDRLKSEAEAALEAAETLRRSEAARLKRMRGEEDSEEEQEGPKRKGKKGNDASRLPQGDDLDDDYGIEGDEVGGFALGLGAGLEAMPEGPADEDKEESGSEASDNEEDEEDEDEDSDTESEVSAGDHAETEMLADLLHRDAEVKDISDEGEASGKSAPPSTSLVSSKKREGKTEKSSLPYTFPCPEDHDQFLDLISGHEDELPTVIERIRTLYHPSLGDGNKQKLAVSQNPPLPSCTAPSANFQWSFPLELPWCPH